MILQDLFMNLAGAQRQPAADPMDTIKGGLLAQLLGRVQGGDQWPAFEQSTALEMGGAPAMPSARVGDPSYQTPAPPMNTPWSDQAPAGPAGDTSKAWTDQAPMPAAMAPLTLPAMPVKDIGPQTAFGAPYTPPPAEAAPAPQQAAPQPGGAPMGLGGPSQQPAPFEPTIGQRIRAFGRALQGADPGDPGQAAEAKNQTMQFLIGKGVAPEEARAMVSNPALLQAALPGMFQGRVSPRLEEIYDDKGRKQKVLINPATGAMVKVGGSAGASDAKAPSGFEWINPQDQSQGLRAIPGGPATHMSVELSGKLALMEEAQKAIPGTKKTLLEPWGALGAGQSLAASMPWVGDIAALSGEIGMAKRNVRAGIEAALRVMTGAAAPETEVRRYMDMFMPGITDTKESAAQKLGLLEGFMNNARELVTRGRTATPGPGGAGNAAPGAGPQAPQGAAPPRDTALAEARAAIAAGKNPDQVRARLSQWGYSLD